MRCSGTPPSRLHCWCRASDQSCSCPRDLDLNDLEDLVDSIMPSGESSSGKDASKEKNREETPSKEGKDGTKHSKDASRPSTSTPAPNDGASFPAATSSPLSSVATNVVIEYLRSRGFERSEAVLKAELEALAAGKSPEAAHAAGIAAGGPATARTMTMNDLASKSAPRDLASVSAGGEKGATAGPGPLEVMAAEALRVDRTDRIRGYGMVRNWCEGGLDVYQVSETIEWNDAKLPSVDLTCDFFSPR